MMIRIKKHLGIVVFGLMASSVPASDIPEPVITTTSGQNPFSLPSLSSLATVQVAHAILVKAIPEKESTLTDIPEEILLTFNEGVGTEYLALAVSDPTGQRVDKHDAHLDFTDHSHLRARVEKLKTGRYTVRYRVLSADGHVVSGKYFFEIK
ncbi:MAG: copper resistance CopC family protein [Methylococcaceae bacterium]